MLDELRDKAICASPALQRERHIPSVPSLTGCVWGTFGRPRAVKGGPQKIPGKSIGDAWAGVNARAALIREQMVAD